ncbi:unnamed protein product [Nesidiocoris tenuis]|uniref:Uncharacterized protein n=1 Tax=Nesidiocoris tenuis TaxID=355587 RepID=A0A6H5H6U5_9HEMI|nr:unnamed protein product [Nesidiocoris tenuis]
MFLLNAFSALSPCTIKQAEFHRGCPRMMFLNQVRLNCFRMWIFEIGRNLRKVSGAGSQMAWRRQGQVAANLSGYRLLSSSETNVSPLLCSEANQDLLNRDVRLLKTYHPSYKSVTVPPISMRSQRNIPKDAKESWSNDFRKIELFTEKWALRGFSGPASGKTAAEAPIDVHRQDAVQVRAATRRQIGERRHHAARRTRPCPRATRLHCRTTMNVLNRLILRIPFLKSKFLIYL